MTNGAGCATARANTNIALVKYWGKRDRTLRLPENGSISLTLDGLLAETTVELGGPSDRLILNGSEREGGPLARVSALLEHVRKRSGSGTHAIVTSTSTVPEAAGLASSASGFAALAVASAYAYGLALAPDELSVLARLGSGSACRSIFGGLVQWRRGEAADGRDSFAMPLCSREVWPLAMAIAVVDPLPKSVGSTDGMARSTKAPGYRHWRATVDADLAAACRAIAERDLRTLGLVAESSSAKMHLTAASCTPPLVYWTEATARLVCTVARWREHDGLDVYATVDAGPNVAVLCLAEDVDDIAARLAGEEGVVRTVACRAGLGASVMTSSGFREVSSFEVRSS